jgi:hypothetical protein
METIDRSREDARNSRLPDSPLSGKQVSMADFTSQHSITQGLYDLYLSDNFGEPLWPPSPVE